MGSEHVVWTDKIAIQVKSCTAPNQEQKRTFNGFNTRLNGKVLHARAKQVIAYIRKGRAIAIQWKGHTMN